jgi:DNA-binding LacI/PurR family transcriptional regulator
VSEPEKARAATIFDVARLAGVSHQTVSRVLNDLPNVRPATRERVEKAIRQLRYVPSPAARALVTRRSRTIGLVVTGAAERGPSSTALHFNAAARDARYAVITASLMRTDVTELRDAAELLVRQNVEAIVLIATDRSGVDALEGVELGVPLVTVASEQRGVQHRVTLDQFGGARSAVDYLIEAGHREIRHVAGPAGSMDASERARAWFAGLSDRGLVAREPIPGDWTPESGFAAGRVLAEQRDFTAVFVANDQMAIGVMRAFAVAGLDVPRDVSVIGFDDLPESEFLSPPLSTVRQDFRGLGRDAMTLVLSVLGDAETPDPPLRAMELLIRGSVAPPRSRDAAAPDGSATDGTLLAVEADSARS